MTYHDIGTDKNNKNININANNIHITKQHVGKQLQVHVNLCI